MHGLGVSAACGKRVTTTTTTTTTAAAILKGLREQGYVCMYVQVGPSGAVTLSKVYIYISIAKSCHTGGQEGPPAFSFFLLSNYIPEPITVVNDSAAFFGSLISLLPTLTLPPLPTVV